MPAGEDAEEEAVPGEGEDQRQVEPLGYPGVLVVGEVKEVGEDIEGIWDQEEPGGEEEVDQDLGVRKGAPGGRGLCPRPAWSARTKTPAPWTPKDRVRSTAAAAVAGSTRW